MPFVGDRIAIDTIALQRLPASRKRRYCLQSPRSLGDVRQIHYLRRTSLAGKNAARHLLEAHWTSRRLLQDSTNVTSALSPSASQATLVNSPMSSGTSNSASSAAVAAGNAGKAATIAAEATGTYIASRYTFSC